MKKILAGILAGGMIFQATAFADNLTEVAELMAAEYTSATVNFEMAFTLNKPMEFLGKMQDYYDEDSYFYMGSDAADYQMLAESLFNSTANATVKVNASDDYKKIDMQMQGEFTLPMQINESWKLSNDMKFGMWMGMDFSSPEDFKYEMTMKMPFSRKYIHFDYAKMMEDNNIPDYSAILNEELITEMQKQSKALLEEALKNNAEIEKQGSKYIISFDNKGFVDFMRKYITGVMGMVKYAINEYSKENETEAFSDYDFTATEEITAAVEKLKEVKMLGDKGLIIEIETALGVISDIGVSCDIDMNIYDMLTVFEEEIPEYITKENSSVAFETRLDYNYSELGSTTIEFPKINEDNCHFMFEEAEDDYDYDDYYTDNEYYYGYANGYCLRGLNSVPYMYFRETVQDYAWEYSGYMYGYREAQPIWNDGIITFTDVRDSLPFDTIVLNSVTGEAFVDGIKMEVAPSPYKHIVVAYGNTYISPELAKAIFGIEVYEYNISFDGFGNPTQADVNYKYPNPNYIPPTSDL